jgi:hypothetical protein
MTAPTTRRAKGPATAEQIAAMNFEPWAHGGDEEWKPPSNAKWAEDGAYLLPFVRMAWICMYKTKPELETMAEKLEEEPFEEMVEGIAHSQKFFKNFVTILQAAEVRIMCAASAAALRAGASDETS